MALVTANDIQTYLGRDLSDVETIAASAVFIPTVEGEASVAVNRPIEAAQFVEEQLVEYDQTSVRLRRSPVVSVVSVVVEGSTVAAADYIVRSWGLDFTTLVGTTLPIAMTITYTAGLDDVLDAPALQALRGVVMGRVARMVNKIVNDDSAGVASITVEGYTVRYMDDGWTEHEADVLASMRRRTVV